MTNRIRYRIYTKIITLIFVYMPRREICVRYDRDEHIDSDRIANSVRQSNFVLLQLNRSVKRESVVRDLYLENERAKRQVHEN